MRPALLLLGTGIVALVVGACSPAKPVVSAAALPPRIQLQSYGELKAAVHAQLMENCKQCHLAWLPTAQPNALKVYDLTKDDWPAKMSERQLNVMRDRLVHEAPFRRERKEPLLIPDLTPSAAVVDDFVVAELAERSGRPR